MQLNAPAHPQAHAPKPFYAHLYVQVIFAIVAGALIGHFYPQTGEALKPLGDAFIKLVKMIIAPVIFLTIVTGLAGMGTLRGVGSVVGKAFAYFLTFSTLALIVGLIVANVIQPGRGMNIDPSTLGIRPGDLDHTIDERAGGDRSVIQVDRHVQQKQLVKPAIQRIDSLDHALLTFPKLRAG